MKGKRYFKCEPNKGMFILAKEIQRKLSPEELIQKIIHLSEALSRARQQRSNNVRSLLTKNELRTKQDELITALQKVNECISNHPQPFQIRHISKHMPSNAEIDEAIVLSLYILSKYPLNVHSRLDTCSLVPPRYPN